MDFRQAPKSEFPVLTILAERRQPLLVGPCRCEVDSDTWPDYHDPKMNEKDNIRLPREKIAEFCKRNRIRKLSLFGSVLRGELREGSDIDLLVEFEPGHVPGLAFFAMENELSEILGRKVDLNTPQFLSRYFREQVLAEAELQYAAS